MNQNCEGCGATLLWAKHVKSGKAAPLVKAPSGVTPNIAVREIDGEMVYCVVTAKSQAVSNPPLVPEYVNHFMNCPKAGSFKGAR